MAVRRRDPSPPTATGVDPAVRQARLVVGLYGDPRVAWSVVVRLGLTAPVAEGEIDERWSRLAAEHPLTGSAGVVRRYAPAERDAVLSSLADEPYGDHDPLLRVALSDDGREAIVAGHHGSVDGLGLLGAAGRLLDVDLATSARGVAADADHTSFLLGSLRRLGEAAFRPPRRFAASPDAGLRGNGSAGDELRSLDVPGRGGTADLVAAAADLVRRWNADPTRGRTRGRRLVVALGLSRRPGAPMATPDRDTAYARLVAEDVHTLEEARLRLAQTPPEPAFPVTEGGGIGPLVTKVLAHRLGSTLLVSNLGRIDDPGVSRVEFWPVPAGPAGVCLGLASAGERRTLTVRARRGWFDAAAADALVEMAGAGLARVRADRGRDDRDQ